MFRGQANQFDEVVAKATDENLTSENWALILDVCDRVTTAPDGPSSAVAALIKRLAHRNANVQLYTLELANALSQNCGAPLHRELASRSFTEAMIRLANDRTSHQQVKSKVLERMSGWSDMFRGDPDLGIMEQAYDRLRKSNPNLLPPSKPVKTEIEDGDRKKEEDELQMALELSLRDKGPDKKEEAGSKAEDAPPQPQGTTAATVSRVRALYDFAPSESGELAFRKGDVIAVLESVYKDWWKGSLRGNTGIFPLNYVEKLQDPTKEDLEKDAMMEGEVFAQIRNVEKLLALLSVRGEGGPGGKNAGDEEEITELYNQTLSIRPKLIELIGKYSQKKDDFTSLNEKFIKARRDYEALLEASMAQPPAGYGYPSQARPPQGYGNAYGQPAYAPPQQQSQMPYQQQRPPQQHQQYAPPPAQHQQYYPPQSQQPSDPYGAPSPSTAFHFLPSGAPPPDMRNNATPKPVAPSSADPGYPQTPAQGQFPQQRPHSTLTLNSGNPSELGAGGYESPIDARHPQHGQQSFPPQPQHQPPAAPGFTPQNEQTQLPMHNSAPQRTSFEGHPGAAPQRTSFDGQAGYATRPQQQPEPQHPQQYPSRQDHQQPQQQTQAPPPQPQGQPPYPPQQQQHQGQLPTSPGYPPQGQYMAYNPSATPVPPQQQQQQQPAQPPQVGSAPGPGYAPHHSAAAPRGSLDGGPGGAGGDDASDFYR